MTLDELQAQTAKDLKVNDEHLDTESLKNQEIKSKYNLYLNVAVACRYSTSVAF